METLTHSGTLVVTSCWCGIGVAIPESLYRQARDQGESVYCPLGHTFVWKKTRVQELENEVARLRDDKTFWRGEAEREQRRARAARGQVTKIKNRVGNGVCPCCKRTFANVARHMANQHPDFTKETA